MQSITKILQSFEAHSVAQNYLRQTYNLCDQIII